VSDKEQGNWFKRHKVLTVIFGFVLLIIIVSAVSSDSSKTSSGGKKAGSSNAQKTYRFADRADKQKKDIEVLPNEPATLDGVKMTVTSAEYKTAISEFETAASGKTYALVNVSLENTSDKTKPYNPFDFRVQTASGQVLDATVVSTPSLNSGDLVTGGKVSGVIPFEVPVEDGHQYLIWKPGLSSDRAIVQIK
jgi:hypothetical protein